MTHHIIDLKFMNTERGTKLLVSGWWGLCRHPNYLYVVPLSLLAWLIFNIAWQGRPHYGPILVSPNRIRDTDHLLLHHLLHYSVAPQTSARR